MKLTLGFSPCPNDTFIFDAMVHGRIDTEGLEFEYFMNDVEELNKKAVNGEADITKISCAAYPFIADKYFILDSGGALGFKNGPLLVTKEENINKPLEEMKVAIPGKYTTANLLLSAAYRNVGSRVEMLFSDIEEAVLRGDVDAGLLIHETRFTYQSKGLVKIIDTGEYWEKLTKLPIPLGVICVNKNLPEDISHKVNRIIQRSIDYAYFDSAASYFFIRDNAREIDQMVVSNHIKLFVTSFSYHLGERGKEAIYRLLNMGRDNGILPAIPDKIFLT